MKAYLGEPVVASITGPERWLVDEDLCRAISCYQANPVSAISQVGLISGSGTEGHPRILEMRVISNPVEIQRFFDFHVYGFSPQELSMSPEEYTKHYDRARYAQALHAMEKLLDAAHDLQAIDLNDPAFEGLEPYRHGLMEIWMKQVEYGDTVNVKRALIRNAMAFKEFFPEYLESLEKRIGR